MGDNFKFLFEYNDYLKNDVENSEKELYIYNEIKKRTKFDKLVLSEGLIFTYPALKSIEIIKRRFPELIVKLEPDGEIYIENHSNTKELKKYLPLFTNLGYFVSIYTIDGQRWIKNYDENSKPIALYLEAKYDLKVEVPEKLYHASPIKYKEKISKIGFIPKTGNKKSAHPDRIYLTSSLETAIKFGENIKEEDGYDCCIYEIDGKCIQNLYSDVNLREQGYYTLQNIPPKCFKLIKEIE